MSASPSPAPLLFDRPAAFVAGWGTSHPPLIANAHAAEVVMQLQRENGQPEEAVNKLAKMVPVLETRALARAIFHQGVATSEETFLGKRCDEFIPDEVVEADKKDLTRAQRNRVWVYYGKRMALDAAQKALKKWGGDASTITHVITTATSGWEEPGLSAHLIHSLDLSLTTAKQELNFNGCFCGMTCVRLARDVVLAGSAIGERRVVLVVACETASVQVSGVDSSLNQTVSHSLFSDGAAAYIVAPEGPWQMVDAGMQLVGDSLDMLRMKPVGDDPSADPRESFHMVMNPTVGQTLGHYFANGAGAELVQKVLNKQGWNGDNTRPSLAVHPGGPRILDGLNPILQKVHGFDATSLDDSYATLRKYGNLGSTAVLFVLAKVLEREPNAILGFAFGPGVTVEWSAFKKASNNY